MIDVTNQLLREKLCKTTLGEALHFARGRINVRLESDGDLVLYIGHYSSFNGRSGEVAPTFRWHK